MEVAVCPMIYIPVVYFYVLNHYQDFLTFNF